MYSCPVFPAAYVIQCTNIILLCNIIHTCVLHITTAVHNVLRECFVSMQQSNFSSQYYDSLVHYASYVSTPYYKRY